MKDFYKRLQLTPEASEAEVRRRLESASPRSRNEAALGSDAQFVLLDPKRRAVYDRNRQLLVTIGELRLHLGLNYTRLWARRDFRDFWRDLAPPPREAAKRRVDPMLIAHAIRSAGRHGRRHAARWGWWVGAGSGALVIAALIYWWWWM